GGSCRAVVDHEHLRVGSNGSVTEPLACAAQAFVLSEGRVEHESACRQLFDCRRKRKEAFELEQPRRPGMLSKQRRPRTDEGVKRHDVSLTEVIDRWVGDLRK